MFNGNPNEYSKSHRLTFMGPLKKSKGDPFTILRSKLGRQYQPVRNQAEYPLWVGANQSD